MLRPRTRGEPHMRIKLSDATQLERLLSYLAFDSNVIVSQVAPDEVEVSFLGSLNTSAQVMQSELRLRLWLEALPDVIATLQEKWLPSRPWPGLSSTPLYTPLP